MPSLPTFAALPALQALPALASLPTRPLGILLRASAAARASSAAPVSDVWAVLAHPGRWVEFDPSVRGVEPVSDELTADVEVFAGEQLCAQLRLVRREIPVEVDHVVNRSSLVTTSQLFHGLAEEVEHLLIPRASGGTLVTARITLHGPFAVPALLPRWLYRSLAVRLLARTAENGLRARSQEIPSVA
jgi:hypothetical protein